MLKLNATTTAPSVVIDLQEAGILPFAGGPYTAMRWSPSRAAGGKVSPTALARVVMVRVGWSDDYAEALNSRWMPQRLRTRCRKTGGPAYGIGQKRQRSGGD